MGDNGERLQNTQSLKVGLIADWLSNTEMCINGCREEQRQCH